MENNLSITIPVQPGKTSRVQLLDVLLIIFPDHVSVAGSCVAVERYLERQQETKLTEGPTRWRIQAFGAKTDADEETPQQ